MLTAPGLASGDIIPRAPKIHVHKRFSNSPIKKLDRDFDAIVCSYNQELGLFKNTTITKIQVTPPAAFEFVRALEEGRETSCVSCQRCGYPHLDLGDFAKNRTRSIFVVIVATIACGVQGQSCLHL